MSDEPIETKPVPTPPSESPAEGIPHQAAKLSLAALLLLVLSGIASRSLREGGMNVVTVE